MDRKKISETRPTHVRTGVILSLYVDEYESLQKLALKYGCRRGSKPSINALVRAIANQKLSLHLMRVRRRKPIACPTASSED